ncbi:MAG: B12-binding domain-containing radical SAM protein [Deltaproteobacteria bacterium]|nr:B12-binding domain-containing radical SAM protein [Deltaproteobacteria bacterium]
MITISDNVQRGLNRSGSDNSGRGEASRKPTLLLIAAATGSKVFNKAFGIRLPLLGYPAIGLAMISALTPDQFHIQLVDEANEPVPNGKKGDLALIVGLTHHMPNAYVIADRLRSEGTKVILGGMHVTALPDEALMHADSIIVGEAEAVWREILDDFVKGSLKKKYSGREVNLAELPPMRRDLFNKKFYYPGQIIETTRGCSVGCVFCGVQNFFGTRFRVRPPEAIQRELMALFGPRPQQTRWKKWLARHWHPDIPYFVERRLLYVMDSNFISDLGHARAVMNVFKECDLRWFGHASFNLMRDDKLVDLLADSGCLGVNIGFESLSQANIDHMHKFPNKTAEYAECIKRLHEREIGVMGTFIVGFDEDTPEVFDQIVDFVIENRLETAFTLILTPKPDTMLFNQMKTQNRMLSHNWRDYDEGTVTFIPKNMTPRQLHSGMRSVWSRIYSWQGIWRRIMTQPRVRPFFYLPMNLGFQRCTRLICSEKIWPAPNLKQHLSEGTAGSSQ